MNLCSIFLDSFRTSFYKKTGLGSPVRSINFAVTYKCNSRCLSCNIWKTYSKKGISVQDELSVDHIRRIFSQLKELKMVSLTGGEPFLREDLVDIVRCIKSGSINISTNGFFTDRILEYCKEILRISHFRKISISVSIDAMGNRNDHIRGLKNAYNRALQTIMALKNLSANDGRLLLSINNTISKNNIDDVLKLYNLSQQLDVGFSTRLAQSSGLFYNNLSSRIFVGEKDMFKVRETFKFLLKEQPRNLFYRYYLNRFLNNPNKQPVPCFSGSNSFFIDPYGTFYPCIMLNKKIGNLKEKSLKQLLNSKEAIEIRQFIRKGKCSCWTDCEALNSIYSNPIELMRAGISFLFK